MNDLLSAYFTNRVIRMLHNGICVFNLHKNCFHTCSGLAKGFSIQKVNIEKKYIYKANGVQAHK